MYHKLIIICVVLIRSCTACSEQYVNFTKNYVTEKEILHKKPKLKVIVSDLRYYQEIDLLIVILIVLYKKLAQEPICISPLWNNLFCVCVCVKW